MLLSLVYGVNCWVASEPCSFMCLFVLSLFFVDGSVLRFLLSAELSAECDNVLRALFQIFCNDVFLELIFNLVLCCYDIILVLSFSAESELWVSSLVLSKLLLVPHNVLSIVFSAESCSYLHKVLCGVEHNVARRSVE
jgi:hypothetical protein